MSTASSACSSTHSSGLAVEQAVALLLLCISSIPDTKSFDILLDVSSTMIEVAVASTATVVAAVESTAHKWLIGWCHGGYLGGCVVAVTG